MAEIALQFAWFLALSFAFFFRAVACHFAWICNFRPTLTTFVWVIDAFAIVPDVPATQSRWLPILHGIHSGRLHISLSPCRIHAPDLAHNCTTKHTHKLLGVSHKCSARRTEQMIAASHHCADKFDCPRPRSGRLLHANTPFVPQAHSNVVFGFHSLNTVRCAHWRTAGHTAEIVHFPKRNRLVAHTQRLLLGLACCCWAATLATGCRWCYVPLIHIVCVVALDVYYKIVVVVVVLCCASSVRVAIILFTRKCHLCVRISFLQQQCPIGTAAREVPV